MNPIPVTCYRSHLPCGCIVTYDRHHDQGFAIVCMIPCTAKHSCVVLTSMKPLPSQQAFDQVAQEIGHKTLEQLVGFNDEEA